jgi:exodeoxyribonuclease VII large subunit
MKKYPWLKTEDSPQQGSLFPAKPPPATVAIQPPPPPLAPAAAPSAAPIVPKPERVIFTVGEITRDIKATLERGYARVWVRGEISGFRGANPRGHLYFSLKDSDACLDAKMWASAAQRLKFNLRDGLSVIAEGSIDLYEPQGRYSLIVQRIEPVGEGALALAFQQLKERLAAEGLLGDARKRPPRAIPFLPRRIGVVTSLHGAALRDFLRVLHQRHPRLPVLICDARVQGEGSAGEVVRAMRRLARANVDVIVLTRGGGSIEDLWTFNEELVARAIHACPVPVVSAIGHEIDFTIADFVADLRAPTPSAAAERLAPVLRDLELYLKTVAGRLRKSVERQILEDRQRLHQFKARLADPRRVLGQKQLHLSEETERMVRAMRLTSAARRERIRALQDRLLRQRPQARLLRNRQQLTRLSERLRASIWEGIRQRRQRLVNSRLAIERSSPVRAVQDNHRHLVSLFSRLKACERERSSTERRRFHTLEARLEALSPLKVMARGYAVVFRADDHRIVRTASQVGPGDSLEIKLTGTGCLSPEDCEQIDATVSAVHPKPSSE